MQSIIEQVTFPRKAIAEMDDIQVKFGGRDLKQGIPQKICPKLVRDTVEITEGLLQ